MKQTNQVKEMLRQYQQDGGDMGELLSFAQTLLSTGKTPLGLNQWDPSDKPTREHFNSDNKIVDDKLREIDSALANKVNIASPTLTMLPHNDGYGGVDSASGIWYSKDQFGRVVLLLTAVNRIGNIAFPINSTLLATLPVGFRPIRAANTVCGFRNTSGSVTTDIAICSINTQGIITITLPGGSASSGAQWLYGSLVFQSS